MTLTTEKLSSPVYQVAMTMLSSGEESVKLLYETILDNTLARNVYLTCKNVENEGMKTYIVFEYTGIKTSESVQDVQYKVEHEPDISRYLEAYSGSSVSVYPSDNANNEQAPELTVSIYRLIDNQEDYNLPMLDAINQFNYNDHAMLHVAKYYNDEPLVNLDDIDKFVDMYEDDINQVKSNLQVFYPGQMQHGELYAAYLLGVQHALNSMKNSMKNSIKNSMKNSEKEEDMMNVPKENVLLYYISEDEEEHAQTIMDLLQNGALLDPQTGEEMKMDHALIKTSQGTVRNYPEDVLLVYLDAHGNQHDQTASSVVHAGMLIDPITDEIMEVDHISLLA